MKTKHFLLSMLALLGNATANAFMVNGINYIDTSSGSNKTVAVFYQHRERFDMDYDEQPNVPSGHVYEKESYWSDDDGGWGWYYNYYYSDYEGNISIPSTVTDAGTTYQVTSVYDYAFCNCTAVTSITLPNSIISIGNCAFWNCRFLTSVAIPSSVTSIGSSAFSSCSNLTSVKVDIDSPLSINYSTFTNRANATLYVPYGSKAAYQAANYWQDFKEIVEPAIVDFADANVKALCVANWDTDNDGELSEEEAAAVTSLGSVFKGNTSITSFNELQYFTGLTGISYDAFSECSNLTSIIIPNGVTYIGDRAFYRCSSLTSVTIPNSVEGINWYAFSQCSSLISITIPESVTYIDNGVFASCSSLTSVNIPNGVKGICENTFSNCSSLTSITIPNSVCDIDKWAFRKCSNLISIDIPNSVKNISEEAFRDCISLTSVIIPNSIKEINNLSFSGCTGLTSVSIPNSVTLIGAQAFENCSSLTSVTIPNSVYLIGSSAFSGCSGLTSVTIPNSMKYLLSNAFWGCSSLRDVWCHAENAPDNSGGFRASDAASATLHVPAGSLQAYSTAAYWNVFGTIAPIYDEESSKAFPAGTYAKADLKHTFVEGWNTICLPFAIDDIEAAFGTGAKAYGFDDFADGELKFSHVTTLTAGTPYVIYVPAEITELIAFENIVVEESNTTSSNIDKNGAYFRGTYAPVAAGEWMKSNGTDEIFGLTADGRIRKAGAEASILGFRGYFDIPAGTEVKGFVFDDATGIDDIEHSSLTIDHPIYNVAGQRIKKMQKGINIINGKKILK